MGKRSARRKPSDHALGHIPTNGLRQVRSLRLWGRFAGTGVVVEELSEVEALSKPEALVFAKLVGVLCTDGGTYSFVATITLSTPARPRNLDVRQLFLWGFSQVDIFYG